MAKFIPQPKCHCQIEMAGLTVTGLIFRNNVILEGEGQAKFEPAFHSCLCKNFMDGNNIAYNQKENDLGQHWKLSR